MLAFILTGLDPTAVLHGQPRELANRLGELTGLRDSRLIELLAGTLADGRSRKLDAAMLLGALASTARRSTTRRPRSTEPLFVSTAHESVLTEGLERLTDVFRLQLDRLIRRRAYEGAKLDAYAGMAGLLYVLAAAQRARTMQLDAALVQRAVRILTTPRPVIPDLPGLVHGRAGRALAVATAVQAGCVSADEGLCAHLRSELAGRLDWPDFTHGAAGQGLAALACARRLGRVDLAAGADACAIYLLKAQDPDGAWTLPEGAPGSER